MKTADELNKEWSESFARSYTVDDIKEAFLAGLNDKGGVLPSQKLQVYLKKVEQKKAGQK